ncbi:MAG: PQQ-binding-like beta-propeller repeat protein, partial [Pseudomonadota bacterium]
TWTGEWWTMGGGGTAWDSFSYDPELDLLYIGVGNGGPWDRNVRSPGGGDNLFLASIVALRPDTGEYVWHYQTTPGESWDYTATQQMILADLPFGGEPRKVLMQAPKNGFFYLLDRATGELLSAEPFVTVNWASHVNLDTGRPVETPGARYEKRPFEARPGPLGGHTWQSMAYHPETGLVYIPAQDLPNLYVADEDFSFIPNALNFGVRYPYHPTPVDPAQLEAVRASLDAFLLAWNPLTQSEAWRVRHAGPGNGGVLATAGGLVFQGTANGRFKAFDAASGEELWSRPTQTGVLAAPISYIADGEQYVAIMVGWGGAYALAGGILNDPESVPNVSRMLAYRLGGSAQLPELERPVYVMPEPPPQTFEPDTVEQGQALYHRFCYLCHGANAVNVRITPDLRASAFLRSAPAWQAVVRDGTLAERGMAAFAKILDAEQADAIRGYIIKEAWVAYRAQQAAADDP